MDEEEMTKDICGLEEDEEGRRVEGDRGGNA